MCTQGNLYLQVNIKIIKLYSHFLKYRTKKSPLLLGKILDALVK